MADFNLPHLHLVPLQGVIPFEFRCVLWHLEKSPWAIVWLWLRDPTFSSFDTIPECDEHRDTRQRHIPLA